MYCSDLKACVQVDKRLILIKLHKERHTVGSTKIDICFLCHFKCPIFYISPAFQRRGSSQQCRFTFCLPPHTQMQILCCIST